ncbi:MAG: putative antibiotic hydrolase [Candidatus Eremiobacteraeota bacterium]|nr:putative antibiotic hydrolase [Candidatus Eremiobacteraeota bacterium]
MTIISRLAGASLIAGMLAGCGGGSTGGTLTPSPRSGTSATSSVTFRVVVPSPASVSASRRAPRYVSTATKSATVIVTPAGGAAGAPVVANCALGTCSGVVTAPVGSDTFDVRLYDQPGGTGGLLSRGSAVQTVLANQTNSVNLTFDPVVASVVLTLSTSALPAGTAATDTLNVIARDAQNMTIVGPGIYVDAAGNPLTITVAKTDDNHSGAGSGTTTLGPVSITGPSVTSVPIAYNGGAMNATTYAATVNGGAAISATPATLTFTPTLVAFYPTPANSFPTAIVAGPDGNLWTAGDRKPGGFNILKISTSGTFTGYTSAAGADIAVGPDGKLWFGGFGGGNVSNITTAGVVTDGVALVGGSTNGLTVLADGSIWITDTTGRIVQTSISAPATNVAYPTSANVYPDRIKLGPDGNLWFTEYFGTSIARITTGGAITEFDTSGGTTNLAVGPDNNVWFTQRVMSRVGYILPGAPNTVTTFPIPGGGDPSGIVKGPDGNLWFTEQKNQKIGRVSTTGTFTMIDTPNTTSDVSSITVGPDGNLWFTDYGGAIGKIVW